MGENTEINDLLDFSSPPSEEENKSSSMAFLYTMIVVGVILVILWFIYSIPDDPQQGFRVLDIMMNPNFSIKP